MPNLPENNAYTPSSGTRPTIADFPAIAKSLQERIRSEVGTKLQDTVSAPFNPAAAYYTEPGAGADVLGRFSSGGLTFPGETPIAKPNPVAGTRYDAIPSYEAFVPTDTQDANNPRWVLPSKEAKISSLPEDVGGGQYVIDPTQPNALIKSQRRLVDQTFNPGYKAKILGGLSGRDFQVDHIVPLWVGGADTAANLQLLDLPTHEKKTSVQAVPLTLLSNGKITLQQARTMALQWKSLDAEGLPVADKYGMLPLDVAEKAAAQWKNPEGKPVSWGDVFKGIPETMKNFGQGWLPNPIREFLKGTASGLTANILPYIAGENEGTLSQAAGIAGNVLGNIAGLVTGEGLALRGLKVGTNLYRYARGTELAVNAAKTAGLATEAIDIGSSASKIIRARKFEDMAKSAGLLSAWGQVGLTGRELTGQQEASFQNHLGQLFTDVAYGSLLGSSGQNLRGYAGVGFGTTALSLMTGNNIQGALTDGIMMAGLHGLGYKANKGKYDPNIIQNEEAFKAASATMNQYLGTDVSAIKKGQKVPEIWTPDLGSVEQMRQKYQKEFPNDPRIQSVGPISNETQAVDFMTRAALARFGKTITTAGKDIPVEDIEKEITRIGTAGNQMYNQTLPPEARTQKQISDWQSLGEKLRPAISSKQYGSVATELTSLKNDAPLKFSDQPLENPVGATFPNNDVPVTGYSGNIDPVSRANVDRLYSLQGSDNVSNRLYIVNDPNLHPVMRLVNYEKMAAGEKPTIAKPEDTLRVYFIEETPNGRTINSVGYISQGERIGAREFHQNLPYEGMMKRIRGFIKNSKNPQELMDTLNDPKKERSISNVDLPTAETLFNQKGTIDSVPDDIILSALNPKDPLIKYDPSFNNSAIANIMRSNGINILTADIKKLLPTGAPTPRARDVDPFLALTISDKNWLESLALKNKETSNAPVLDTIREIKSRQDAKDMVQSIKESRPMIESPQIREASVPYSGQVDTVPFKLSDFSKTGEIVPEKVTQKLPLPETTRVTSNPLADKVVSKLQRFKPVESKPVIPEPESLPPREPVTGTPEQKISQLSKEESEVVQTAFNEGRDFTPAEVKRIEEIDFEKAKATEPLKTTGLIEKLVEAKKLTSKEAEPYMNMEREIGSLTQEATNRALSNHELDRIGSLGSEIRKFLEKKGLKKPAAIPGYESGNISKSIRTVIARDRFSEPNQGSSRDSQLAEAVFAEDQKQRALDIVAKIKNLKPGKEKSELETSLSEILKRNEIANPGLSDIVTNALNKKSKLNKNWIIDQEGKRDFRAEDKEMLDSMRMLGFSETEADNAIMGKKSIFVQSVAERTKEAINESSKTSYKWGFNKFNDLALTDIASQLGGGKDWGKNWSLNSYFTDTTRKGNNFMRSLYKEWNDNMHYRSQYKPYVEEFVKARRESPGGILTKDQIAKIDEVTRQRTVELDKARESRENMEKGINQEEGVGSQVGEFLNREDLSSGGNVRVKDIAQLESDMLTDLTKFDDFSMGRLYEEAIPGVELNSIDGAQDAMGFIATLVKEINKNRKLEGKPTVKFDSKKIESEIRKEMGGAFSKDVSAIASNPD